MSSPTESPRRADAARNREHIFAAARGLLADRSREVSMAEVARRANVGMATLYRNFAGRRELLEALFAEEVDELCHAAEDLAGPAGEALRTWLLRFAAFHESKHPIAVELLRDADTTDQVFSSSRDRVLAAGRPLLVKAQEAGATRTDLTLEQILDLVLAVVAIPGDARYVEPLLHTVLDGISHEGSRM